MNTFIQHDSNFKVTAVLSSEEETVQDFIKISGTIPEPTDEMPILFYNRKNGECYFAVEPPTEQQLMAQENADLRNRLGVLEDVVMFMTMPNL